MALLPPGGLTAYNGVVFPAETETVSIDSKPVPDSSGRTVAFILYVITLRATIGASNQSFGESTDGQMGVLRKRLTTYGGEFHYENVGFGNLTINVQGQPLNASLAYTPPGQSPPVPAAGPARDAQWGPKPTMLRWKPIGADQSAEILWTVEVRVPECDAAQYQFALYEAVFRLSYDVDQSGYTTRNYSGHVCVAQTRGSVADHTLHDTADRYREQINPALVSGFRRIPGRFALSEDKCRLDWEIKDVEIGPNYPPPGVVEVAMDHSASTPNVFKGEYTSVLSATYEVARDVPRSVPLQHFATVLNDRMNKARGVNFQGKQNTVLVRSLTVREPEIYGRKCAAFTATYTYLAGVSDIMRASGMWTPVPNSNWQQWAQSLQNSAFHQRGNAKLYHSPGEAIIDLCASGAVAVPSVTALRSTPTGQVRQTVIRNPQPTAETSWLNYWCMLWLYQIDQTVELKPLPPGDSLNRLTTGGGGGTLGFITTGGGGGGHLIRTQAAAGARNRLPGNGGGSLEGPGRSTIPFPADAQPQIRPYIQAGGGGNGPNKSEIQVRSTPRFGCLLMGAARRAGYPIAPPTLVSVGGVTPVPANQEGDGSGCWVAGDAFGVPIYGAAWRLRYILPDTPVGNIPIMSNPLGGV